ncbi:DUF1189 family protein [Gracilibacillus kekensis]|uniref:DUF1189 domain-containing protein n=1 Tax=Gracilibacillus kekensis TaxID=1027249 RepID=A0A1M7JG01_9BACI|nr:DUF1189 family protein [Gracilibacillus kekensis]SHM51895.1 Protein of unknown function [Gracilibacillus kekensis]
MAILSILRKSASLPKKEAMFWLNRISMRDTLVYLFLLFFISFLPNVILIISQFDPTQSQIPYSQYLLQVIVFYPFFMMFLIVSSISILTLGSWLIKWLCQRKLAYQQLWKMTSYALLWPLLIYHLLFFTKLPVTFSFTIGLVLLYIILFKMIISYPKKK